MKHLIPLTAITAIVASGTVSAQIPAYSKPSGYTTQTLRANTLNLVGFNVLPQVVVAGSVTAVSGSVISDSSANFTTALVAGRSYTLEITSGTTTTPATPGTVPGLVQDFNAWAGSNITLPSSVPGLAVGDKYAVRIIPTLQETFPVGFLTGAASSLNADKVWVPDGLGGYTKYYYRITVSPIGWRTTTTGSNDTGAAPANIPLPYIDGILVEKKGVAKDLVLTGSVKTTGSNNLVVTGLNPLSIVSPVGSTLQTSGLQGDIASSASALNADKVWVPNGLGGFTKYYHRITVSPTGWRTTTTGSNDTGAAPASVPLDGAVFIERRGAAKSISLDVPTGYSSL